MKKIIMFALCAALCLGLGAPSFAVEMSPQDAADVPTAFAVVKDGTPVYGKSPTAYSPMELNNILESCGFELAPDAVTDDLPPYFAKASDGKVVFGKSPTAYSGKDLNAILSAYGLTISPEAVQDKLGGTTFATVKGDKIVFSNSPTAYSGKTLAAILSAYSGPEEMVEMEEEVVVVEKDSDGDGVIDRLDRCPNTPMGVEVDEYGCPIEKGVAPAPMDSDADGVPDSSDICPGTPAGAVIDERGCWVLNQDYLFDFDKATLKPQYYSMLDDVVRVMEANPGLRVEIQGHTDSIGSHDYNMNLSQRRAKAVRDYLVNQAGIASSRVTTVGFGETRPIATNATKEGRAKNRRVELNPLW